MEWFVKAFIRASLAWFALGIALGLVMAANPPWVAYRPAHAHMNVVGFLTMMVFGVGYQLLPRLFGHALYSRKLAIAHGFHEEDISFTGHVIDLPQPIALEGGHVIAKN